MAEKASNERRVLVAVDEGDESMCALSWCLMKLVFQNSRDTLILLYVKPISHNYTDLLSSGIDDIESNMGSVLYKDSTEARERQRQEVADCVMEKAKKLCKDLQQVKVETRIENGKARDVIHEMAKNLAADVLVMGSHGYGIIKRTFEGNLQESVSTYYAQNVRCPVSVSE